MSLYPQSACPPICTAVTTEHLVIPTDACLVFVAPKATESVRFQDFINHQRAISRTRDLLQLPFCKFSVNNFRIPSSRAATVNSVASVLIPTNSPFPVSTLQTFSEDAHQNQKVRKV